MARDTGPQRVWTKLITGGAIGVVAMYVLDPDKGRRRRAIARDKARSLLIDTRDALGMTRRDVAHRMQGLGAQARRFVSGRPARDDLQVIERVRARMGRLVSHPHAIQVGAFQGRVTLSGPILAHEVQPLLAAVRTVWGVADVEDRLVVHDHPDSVPSLQGGEQRRSNRAMAHENWPPALRAAALLSGTWIAVHGMRERSLAGSLMMACGLVLAVRAATNRSLAHLTQAAHEDAVEDRPRAARRDEPPELAREAPRAEPAAAAAQKRPSALH
jgi:hypothetical protein